VSLDLAIYATADLGGAEPFRFEIDSHNVTHNLVPMAQEAGIYEALWRPEELVDTPRLRNIEPVVRNGLALLKADTERFEAMNPKNGWGSRKNLVEACEWVLRWAESYPLAMIEACR
jgi:hypothetical protein